MKEIENFENDVLKSDKPVFVDFWASWCAPCRTLIPMLEEVAKENESVSFVKVNADENSDLAQKYGIRGLPTVLLFKDGEVLRSFVGADVKDDIVASISEDV